MIEKTIYAYKNEIGMLGGVVLPFKPNMLEIKRAVNHYSFVHSDTRIHVLAIGEWVTELQARTLAVNAYYGKTEKHDLPSGLPVPKKKR